MSEKPLVGILVGIAVWLATSAVGFLLRRHRLGKALIEDIKHRISNLEEMKAYLDEYFTNNIKTGVAIKNFAKYTKDEFSFYEDVREDLYKYFGATKLITFIRCYEALEEIEILMSGLNEDFCDYGKTQKQLADDDVTLLGRRKDRIISVIEVLRRKEVRSIADLPTDYRGRVSAVQVIKK